MFKIFKYSIYIFILCSFSLTALANNKEKALIETQNILNNLFQVNGNFIYKQPSLRISNGSKYIARYFPKKDLIELEYNAYQVCKSFGEFSDDAIAFIIGHELIHALEEKQRKRYNKVKTPAFDFIIKNEKKDEVAADVQSIFNAYLAGYQTVNILPEVLEKLYKTYNLHKNKSKNHPNLQERQKTVEEVLNKVEELISIYKGGNYLTSIGQYKLAAVSFNHILKFYKGKEVYNNLAVNSTFHALNLSALNMDLFAYPLELDWESRFKKNRPTRGNQPDNEEKKERQKYLLSALNNLKIAQYLDATYAKSRINMICILSLLGENQKAIDYYEEEFTPKITNLNANHAFHNLAKFALAIAHARLNTRKSKEKAKIIWESFVTSNNPLLAAQAQANLSVLEHRRLKEILEKNSCEPVLENRLMPNKLDRPLFDSKNYLYLDEEQGIKISIQKDSSFTAYQYFFDRKCIELQIIKTEVPLVGIARTNKHNDNTYLNNILFGNCKEKQIVYRYNEEGILQEWAKYNTIKYD